MALSQEEIKRRAKMLLADAYLEIGKPNEAVDVYKTLGEQAPKDKLTKCGEICFEQKKFEKAIDAFTLAGDKAGLLKCAETHFKRGLFDKAAQIFAMAGDKAGLLKCAEAFFKTKQRYPFDLIKAFEALGEPLPKDKLIELGEKHLNQKNLVWAEDIFRAVKYKAGLLKCGEAFLKEGDLYMAVEAYKAAGEQTPKNRLIEYGENCLKNHNMGSAIYAFEKAEDNAGLLKCGEASLAYGQLDYAIRAYEKAGEPMPKDKLIECGEKCLKNGQLLNASEAYKKAGEPMPKDKLIELGEKHLKNGQLDYAIEIYKKAGEPIPKDKLIECGEQCLINADKDDDGPTNYHAQAIKAFEMAAKIE